jgi:hypothetical protein
LSDLLNKSSSSAIVRPFKKPIIAILIAMIVISSGKARGNESPKKEPFHPKTYIHVQSGEQDYFVSRSSSEVIISKDNDSKHYGNSIPHYAFQGFRPFTYEGKLLAIGGYGFWRINPFLLEFDTIKGWNPHKLGELYTPTTNSYIHISGDSLILFGGQILEDNLIDFRTCTKIQYIDLITQKCFYSINVEILKDASILASKDGRLVIKNKAGYFLIHLKSLTINKLAVNTQNIHVFEKPEIYKATEDELVINNISIPFTHINETTLKPTLAQTILGILGLLLVTLLVLNYRSIIGKTPVIKKSTTTKNNILELNDKERALINLITTGPKLLSELHELFPSQLSQSHKTKLVRELISQVNSKSNLFDKKIILVGNDEIDSRRKVFYLSDSFNIEQFDIYDKVKS